MNLYSSAFRPQLYGLICFKFLVLAVRVAALIVTLLWRVVSLIMALRAVVLLALVLWFVALTVGAVVIALVQLEDLVRL